MLASASSFYRRVQGQDVGLESNAVNHANDVGNFFAAAVDFVHGVHHLLHHRAAFLRDTRGAGGQLRGLTGVVCAVLHVASQLLHGRGGSLQVARGLLGTHGQVVVARGNFGTCGCNAVGGLTDLLHHARQRFIHTGQRPHEFTKFVLSVLVNSDRQITLRNARSQCIGFFKRRAYGANQPA